MTSALCKETVCKNQQRLEDLEKNYASRYAWIFPTAELSDWSLLHPAAMFSTGNKMCDWFG